MTTLHRGPELSTHPEFNQPPKKSRKSLYAAVGGGAVALLTTGAVLLTGGGKSGGNHQSSGPRPETSTSAVENPTHSTTPPSETVTSPSVITSTSPSSVETSPNTHNYDPYTTFEGYSPEHPATVADFTPIPKDATPEQMLATVTRYMNMLSASGSEQLYEQVRSMLLDPSSHDTNIDAFLKEAIAGQKTNPDLGLGPTITKAEIMDNTKPLRTTSPSGDPVVLVTEGSSAQAYNNNGGQHLLTTINRSDTPVQIAFIYRSDLPTPVGDGTTEGWVLTTTQLAIGQ